MYSFVKFDRQPISWFGNCALCRATNWFCVQTNNLLLHAISLAFLRQNDLQNHHYLQRRTEEETQDHLEVLCFLPLLTSFQGGKMIGHLCMYVILSFLAKLQMKMFQKPQSLVPNSNERYGQKTFHMKNWCRNIRCMMTWINVLRMPNLQSVEKRHSVQISILYLYIQRWNQIVG